nr:hypothetical protein [Polyangiaceae bacterium]
MKYISSSGLSLFLSSIVLVACGGAKEEIAQPQVPVSPAPPETVATVAPVAPKLEEVAPVPQFATVKMPDRIPNPGQVACIWSTKTWTAGSIKLRFSPTSPAFSSMQNPDNVKVVLAAGRNKEASLAEVDMGSVTIRAVLPSDEIPLYPTTAAPVGGFAVPLGSARVKLRESSVDAVTFGVETGPLMKPASDLRSSKPCAYFAISEQSFDPVPATGSPWTARAAVLRPLKTSLQTKLDGGESASLDVNDSGQRVAVLATSGDSSRIAWQTADALYFGWVSTKGLVNSAEAVNAPSFKTTTTAAGKPTKRDTGIAAWKKVTCPEELPLVAQTKTEKFTVGSVKASKVIQLGPNSNGLTRVAFPETDLLAEG